MHRVKDYKEIAIIILLQIFVVLTIVPLTTSIYYVGTVAIAYLLLDQD